MHRHSVVENDIFSWCTLLLYRGVHPQALPMVQVGPRTMRYEASGPEFLRVSIDVHVTKSLVLTSISMRK